MSSVYTELSGPRCKTVETDDETGATVQRCPGVAGYTLLVADDDARMSVTVVTPQGAEHPLDYWNVVTRGFSALGEKAEWRMLERGGTQTPVALIVRVIPQNRSKAGAQPSSYLAVAKIGREETCVTEKIEPGDYANEKAREAADASGDDPCRKP